MASILKARLSGGLVPAVLDEQGIQMCARKVANVSGDLRKAFQVQPCSVYVRCVVWYIRIRSIHSELSKKD